MGLPKCRFCQSRLTTTFADLGATPLSNSFLTQVRLGAMEPFYPLHAYVCDECLLVQLEEFESPQAIFGDYAYFSSYSDTWLEHAHRYVGIMVDRFGLSQQSQVVEVASNDGYLLQYFAERGIPALGIEPAGNVAEKAIAKGIPTDMAFFGVETARRLANQGRRADLLVGNNVLPHVPDVNDFVAGIKILLAPNGIVTMEFPHLLRLIAGNQFDTIYHEHFSYFSLLTAERIFAAHGLRLFDVEELPTHGGSIRVFACHHEQSRHSTGRVESLKKVETDFGLRDLDVYRSFDSRIKSVKRQLLSFLIEAKQAGKSIAGYGAPAKGNTLLNYCGIRSDFIEFTVDRSPHKQGRYLPGSRIPIRHPDELRTARPDYVLILPWNLCDEIVEQVGYIKEWGGQFVAPIPEVRVIPHVDIRMAA
jgi:2-polyprenyl-3-methyl-5-hydroxy-6-metoxy-1,4-benzoquinol methylase